MTENQATQAPGAEPVVSAIESRTLSIPTLSVLAFLVGVVAAMGAALFRYMIAAVHNLFFLGKFSFFYDANQFDPPGPFGPFIILAPVIGGLVVVWLVQTFAPEAKGHGVPEVMDAIYHKKGNVRGIVAVVKSLASAISIGSGASVGREGPIIQIGASFGSTMARLLNLARWQKITLLAAGAGAGIAATFNTPLGGVLFAVELLLPEVSNRTFLPVVVATATATSIARFIFGLDPAFMVPVAALPPRAAFDPIELMWFAILGIAAGIASWAFIRLLAWCEDVFPAMPGNAYTQNIVGMLMIGVIAYAFQVTTGQLHTAGVGYATVQTILNGNMSLVWLFLALLAGKVVATSISLGSGASGGVFSPSLFVGATLGGVVGALAIQMFPQEHFTIVEFAVVGMGAIVGAATGASMTAIVMIFEMTRDYNVIVPLVLAVAIAVGIRRALVTENIYTIKLRHRGRAIPTIRHTNMYLVRQAREVMSKDFVVLPIDTLVVSALAELAERGARHIIVADSDRIAGFARISSGYTPDRYAGETLRAVLADDFVIAPATSILNTIISRMNQRQRSLAIVLGHQGGVPRADDVVGIIDAPEIANAVISNHYA
ncbi:MAG TPA: chloride channel protein [Devosiaceae bacterium]